MLENLTIEMEAECITCPKLSLETHTMYFNDGTTYKVHKCEHSDFCETVWQNWKKYHKGEQGNER